MKAQTLAEPTIRRLDHLPIIGQILRALRIREHVDARIEHDPRSHVTAGECVEALIVAILLGKHTLYRVDELLAPYDLEVAFGWKGEALHFNDTRLAKALDDLFAAGPSAVHASVVATAVDVLRLELKQLHFDTTTAKVYGEYPTSREPEDPEEPDAIPHVTRGHSKDHRPDLKQIVISLTATVDGAVPIAGRAASGNRSDSLEADYVLRDLAQKLPNLSEVILVADSKFFGGRHLEAVDHLDLAYVTLIPRNVGLWKQAFSALQRTRAEGELPELKLKEGSKLKDPDQVWSGLSTDLIYEWRSEEGEDVSIPVRALAVYSTALQQRKRGSVEKRKQVEEKRLARLSVKLAERAFHCVEDAEVAEQAFQAAPKVFHSVDSVVRWEDLPAKRKKPGRPKKGEATPVKRVWRVDADVSEVPGAVEEVLLEASCFVLATNVPRAGAKRAFSDAEVLAAYDDQQSVEGCMHWAKGPLEVAPIFLKTPLRIGALCAVYVLALMVYALIQREIRRKLQAAKTTMPNNRGKPWTDKPTAEVLFRLFEGVFATRGFLPDGRVLVSNTNTEQIRILRLLGNDLLHTPGVVFAKPRQPRRGERASKPVPLSAAEKAKRAASRERRRREKQRRGRS